MGGQVRVEEGETERKHTEEWQSGGMGENVILYLKPFDCLSVCVVGSARVCGARRCAPVCVGVRHTRVCLYTRGCVCVSVGVFVFCFFCFLCGFVWLFVCVVCL